MTITVEIPCQQARQKCVHFFTLKNSGEEVVRACAYHRMDECACAWWKTKCNLLGTQPALTRMHCPVEYLIELKYLTNQLRHTHKQICAARFVQRNLCWLSQGLVRLNTWNCHHVGLRPVKWIFENYVKGSLRSCAARKHVNYRLLGTQIVFWGLDPQNGPVSLRIICLVGQPIHTKNR